MNDKVPLNVWGITYNREQPETYILILVRGGGRAADACCHQTGRSAVYHGIYTAGCASAATHARFVLVVVQSLRY